MSNTLTLIRGNVWQDGGAFLMARVLGNAGTAVTQASISSIAYAVRDVTAPTTSAVLSGTLTVSSVVYDTLQTSDPRWTEDSTGYNFAYAAPASWFPEGGKAYLVVFTFTPASGAVFRVPFEVRVSYLDGV